MKRPEINGWEVTTNENGIKMATLPRDTMEEIVKFVEYADKQLRLGAVVGQSEQLKAFIVDYISEFELEGATGWERYNEAKELIKSI